MSSFKEERKVRAAWQEAMRPSKGSPRADSRVLSLQHGPFPDPQTGLPLAFPNCISNTLAGTLHLTFILPC